MVFKVVAGLVAAILMVVYLAPPVYKLKEWELGVVVAIGIVLMLIDLWQSLRSEDD